MTHGPKGVSKKELRRLGVKEAKEVSKNLPLNKRVVKEVENYNDEYGPVASMADVVTEVNSRGKDLEFQGELEYYAKNDSGPVRRALEKAVQEGKLVKVVGPSSRVGYALPGTKIATGELSKNPGKVRYESEDKSGRDITGEKSYSIFPRDLAPFRISEKGNQSVTGSWKTNRKTRRKFKK